MPRRCFHYLFVALLLIAQQGALVHATWHAGEALAHEHHAHDGDASHEPPAGEGSLCAFDLAFGQVLGGVHGACAPLLAVVAPAAATAWASNPRLSAESIAAQSRGPPLYL